MKDSSLVVFTLSSQTAAGMIVWLAFLTVTRTRLPLSETVILGAALVLAAIALFISTAHLGYPRNALHALRNWRTSWLSREIGLAVAFSAWVGLLFLGTWLPVTDWGRSGLPVWAIGIAALLGVGLVLAEVNVYRLRTALGWSERWSGPNFLLTAWLSGGVVLALMTIVAANWLELAVFNPWFPVVPGLLAGLGLQILVSLAGLAGRGRFRQQALAILRPLCLLSAVFALFFWQILPAAGLILLGESFGRIAFYANRRRVGV